MKHKMLPIVNNSHVDTMLLGTLVHATGKSATELAAAVKYTESPNPSRILLLKVVHQIVDGHKAL